MGYITIISCFFYCSIIITLPKLAFTGYKNVDVINKVFANRTLDKSNSRTLFSDSDVRGDGLVGWFISPKKADELIQLLANEYVRGDVALDLRDKEIVKVIKADLGGYYMHVPQLKYKQAYKSLLITYEKTGVYEIIGWNSIKLDDANIDKFFKLLLGGAHFVIIGDNNFQHDVSTLKHSTKNYKHSHYKETPDRLVFPDITWKTRDPAPIITALLIDAAQGTKGQKIGTFFQLEGWPVHAKSDYLNDTLYHAIDFLLHNDTLWNISTYGMSPYSEKRGTTIFLTKNAPPSEDIAASSFKSNYKKYAVEKRW